MSDCKKLFESFYNTDTEDFSKYIRESVNESGNMTELIVWMKDRGSYLAGATEDTDVAMDWSYWPDAEVGDLLARCEVPRDQVDQFTNEGTSDAVIGDGYEAMTKLRSLVGEGGLDIVNEVTPDSQNESIREKEWSQEDGPDPEPMRSGPAPRKNVREVQVGDIAEYKTGQGIVGAVTSDGVEIMAGPKKSFKVLFADLIEVRPYWSEADIKQMKLQNESVVKEAQSPELQQRIKDERGKILQMMADKGTSPEQIEVWMKDPDKLSMINALAYTAIPKEERANLGVTESMNEEMDLSGVHVAVVKDGKILYKANSENDAMAYLHKVHSGSASNAIQNEGYRIFVDGEDVSSHFILPEHK